MLEVTTIKDVQKSLGLWCRLLRKRDKLTQQDLASELSLSPITISKVESGENATLDTILKILQYFDQMDNLNTFVSEKITNLNDTKSLY